MISVRGKVSLMAGIAVFIVLAGCLPPSAMAQNVTTKTVNCDTPGAADYNSIHQALNNLDWNGPIEIEVTGTCHEHITIGDGGFARNSVYIHPPDGQRAAITLVSTAAEGIVNVVMICGAHGIEIDRMDISGGANGVMLCDASEVDFVDVTIENNTFTGVQMFGNSIAFFSGPSRIRNNGFIGVNLGDTPGGGRLGQGANTVSFLGGNTPDTEVNVVEGNGQLGVNAGALGVVHFFGANLVRNNGGSATAGTRGGIHASRTSVVQIQPHAIRGGATEIAGNTGPGVLAEVNSSVTLQGTNIHNNSEQGVSARTRSVLELVGQNTFSSNGIASIACDVWSLVTGDFTGIDSKTMDCKNIDVTKR